MEPAGSSRVSDAMEAVCETRSVALKEYLLEQARLAARKHPVLEPQMSWYVRRQHLRSKITALIESVVESVSIGRLPSLEITFDSWDSVNVETGVLRSKDSFSRCSDLGTVNKVERFARLMVVLKIVYSLLTRNEISTVRQIFYDNVKLFENQMNVSLVLHDIAKLLDCSRRDLNVVSTAKVETSANVVLIVEKDAIFQKLLDQDALTFFRNLNIDLLLVTGKGVPDLNTRQLIHILAHLAIPLAKFFVLTDADAYGIEIAGIYSFGSLVQAYAENYGVPQISFNMRPESRIVSSTMHQKRLQNLLVRPWMKLRRQWYQEVLKLLSLRCKAEIQALDQFGHSFLLRTYLSDKLRGKEGAEL
ncbi:meiotic recombination protein SPO11 [Galendromus occidentalis]|uniref:DNA topoisomerase (ATP-hydrolyzing) n=1 Tax=Galendromus occidentalis TaxID=34638 RepID=A0AAJ7WGT2_9ACAR|nr:meiotic recombination protein SPO11 [Galendromus occidentalis]